LINNSDYMQLHADTIVDNEGFHQQKGQTMREETSLSHLLRVEPNAFVREGRSYGHALADYVLSEGLIPEGKSSLLFVGDGLGHVAASSLPLYLAAREIERCTMFDISENLLNSQRELTARFGELMSYVKGNAEMLDTYFSNCFFDRPSFVLFNEGLADLKTIANLPLTRGGESTGTPRLPHGTPEEQREWAVAWDKIEKYGLDVPIMGEDLEEVWVPHAGRIANIRSFALNYGVIEFVERLHEILPQNGSAMVVEYTSPFAEITPLTGHVEYSVSTRHLEKVFDQLGFSWRKGNVNDFLGVDPSSKMMDPVYMAKWRMIEMPPTLYGRQGNSTAMQELNERFESDPARYKFLDQAVTVEEFRRLNREHNWVEDGYFDAPGLLDMCPITKDVPVGSFTYYVLTKED
jgi:hypothetical protein